MIVVGVVVVGENAHLYCVASVEQLLLGKKPIKKLGFYLLFPAACAGSPPFAALSPVPPLIPILL
jgi:hypothetical protein